MRRDLLLKTALLAMIASACGQTGTAPQVQESRPEPAERLSVYTVNYPLLYLAERIGGDAVEAVLPAPAGVDPAYWSPDAETVIAYQGADLVLLNGAGYAGWVRMASLPGGSQVDTSTALADRLIELEQTVTHSHGPGGEHEHAGFAFTTWLDPTLAAEHARAVTEALAAARPERAAAFRSALGEVEADLAALDARLAAACETIGETPLLFSHPVYQYLTRRYSLNARSLHWEPDEAPDLQELHRILGEHPAQWMVWEAEPLPDTMAALDQIGVSSAVFDPCANRPASADLMAVMDANATALEHIAAALGNDG